MSQQVEIISTPEKKVLTRKHVFWMKKSDPCLVSLNCQTFFCFVFYGLMDATNYKKMLEEDYEPWKERANWYYWNISEHNESARYEAWAHYALHRDMCLKHPLFHIQQTPDMGLGLFTRIPGIKFQQIYNGDIHNELIGFIEWIVEDTAYNHYNDNNFPSLYSDPEGNKGILYGPLYFCNHQNWAQPFESIAHDARSYQLSIVTRELQKY